MNHVTRGMGRTSGMLVTGGLGRRVIVIIEILAQHVAAVSRVWAIHPNARIWTFEGTRVWDAVATARSWVRKTRSRTWAKFIDSRSWIAARLRFWSYDGDD
jgi:hypothetical protein